jgi:hypothetical protein
VLYFIGLEVPSTEVVGVKTVVFQNLNEIF